MAEITATIGYGKANLRTVSATFASMKVSPPFARISAVNSGRRAGAPITSPVGNWDGAGALISVPTAHPVGTVIMLQCKWMRGVHLVREGGLFLRLRPGAPVYSIIASVPVDDTTIIGDSWQMFSGPADILNVAELKLLGIDVPRGYVSRYMDEEELSECYRIVQTSPESQPRPAITAIATPEGVEMREVVQAPSRRLHIRRRA